MSQPQAELTKELPPIPEHLKGYQCEILADSINSYNQTRLISAKIKYPLIAHPDMLRHRCFSRSVASNRSISTARFIQMVLEDPFIPDRFPVEKKGMQAEEYYEPGSDEYAAAVYGWEVARDNAVRSVKALSGIDNCWISVPGYGSIHVHKQIVNRLLAPWLWCIEIISGTDWNNFLCLRDRESAKEILPKLNIKDDIEEKDMAQWEVTKITRMVRASIEKSIPVPRNGQLHDGSHLVYVNDGERWDLWEEGMRLQKDNDPLVQRLQKVAYISDPGYLCKMVSAARTARTSLVTYEGKQFSREEDIDLFFRLVGQVPRHVSPTEHQAKPLWSSNYMANFRGWKQFRKDITNDFIPG